MSNQQNKTEKKVLHLTTEELAARYRMHPTSVANWRVSGQGPKYIKAGKRVLYPLNEVEAWEAERVHRSTADES